VISGSIILFLGAIIITAGVGGRAMANSFLIEPMVGSTLQDIEDQALPPLRANFYSQYLNGIKDGVVDALGGPANFGLFVNGSTSMGVLGATIPTLAAGYPLYYGNPLLATWGIFNDTIQAFGSPVKGVIEWAGVPLTYSLNDAINLTQGTTAGLPGFLEPDPLMDGTPGMLAFLGIYANPMSVGAANTTVLAAFYGLPSVTHLDLVAGWITTELWNFVPTAIQGGLLWTSAPPAATAADADNYIIVQWAELALIPGGLGTMDPSATGFEVGTHFAGWDEAKATWDSLTDLDEFERWYVGDTALISELGISTSAYNDVVAYVDTIEPIVQGLVNSLYSKLIPGPNFYLDAFLSQWMEYYLLEDGLAPGFEIDFATVNILDFAVARALWADLTSEEGIKEWFAAVNDRYGPEYDAKADEFGLNFETMKDVTNYLAEWRDTTLFALNMQEEMIALPIWGYDLASALDDLELYLPIGGGVFACAGVLLIALFARKRA
jgi:hypothetical protein